MTTKKEYTELDPTDISSKDFKNLPKDQQIKHLKRAFHHVQAMNEIQDEITTKAQHERQQAIEQAFDRAEGKLPQIRSLLVELFLDFSTNERKDVDEITQEEMLTIFGVFNH